MQMIPALAILTALLVLCLALFFKLNGEQLLGAFSGRALALSIAAGLFGLVLVAHLFAPQEWTADVLKVLVGVLVGGGAAHAAESRESGAVTSQDSAVHAAGARFGDNAKLAGRDINETIERLQSEVTNIKDAVVNQYPTLVRAIDALTESDEKAEDYVINTLFERGAESLAEGFGEVVGRWQSEGWRLRHVTSDYQGMDGVTLVFSRPAVGLHPAVMAYHGSRMEAVKRAG
jgi:hypothetical protein